MDKLTAIDFKKAIISASNNLFNNKERIDALNVFPVPDGDTGSNMSNTIQKAANFIESRDYDDIFDLINVVSREMLLGARGNSGVILSQIFKGFSIAWTNKKCLESRDILLGFKQAKETAYDSVLKPIEGTILTVVRETYEGLENQNNLNKMNIIEVFKLAIELATKSLKNTPNYLPVLKEVGVVDSGGEGFLVILKGILSALEGKIIEIDLNKTMQLEFVSEVEIYDGEFGYCTELIIELSAKVVSKFLKSEFVKSIEKHGNSLVVINDKEILKIHIHTLKPGKILNICQKYGEFKNIKIENMSEQASSAKNKVNDNNLIATQNNKKNCSIISCNAGAGFINLMKQCECDYIIECGQTNNPSSQEILEAINYVNSDNVFVLTNNSNIILAAQQAAQISNKNVFVIPTKSQAEGVCAMLNFSHENDPEDNLEEIKTSLNKLTIGQITKSIKDTKINGIKIKQNDFLMIFDNKIVDTNKSSKKAAIELIEKMLKEKEEYEILTIYYGIDASIAESEEIKNYILNNYNIDVDVQSGDQPIYNYIFALE